MTTRKCLQTDGKTDRWKMDAGEIPFRKAPQRANDQGAICEGIIHSSPSAYSCQEGSMRMVAICGPIGTHRALYGSYMRRELYAVLHCNHHFVDSKFSYN